MEELIRQIRGKGGLPAHALRARVVTARVVAGLATSVAPKASVDVQPLLPGGEPDPSWPLLAEVPVDIGQGGVGRMQLALPQPGAVVRVGFYYGDPADPYIEATLAEGNVLPSMGAGDLWVQLGAGVRLRVGDAVVEVIAPRVEIQSPDVRLGQALDELVRASFLDAFAAHTHPTPSGPSGPPSAPLAPARSTGVRA